MIGSTQIENMCVFLFQPYCTNFALHVSVLVHSRADTARDHQRPIHISPGSAPQSAWEQIDDPLSAFNSLVGVGQISITEYYFVYALHDQSLLVLSPYESTVGLSAHVVTGASPAIFEAVPFISQESNARFLGAPSIPQKSSFALDQLVHGCLSKPNDVLLSCISLVSALQHQS